MPWSTSSPNRNRQIILPQSADYDFQKPIRSESRARQVAGNAKGRYWLGQLTSGAVTDTKQIAEPRALQRSAIRMTLSLAFVSPASVKCAIEGGLPPGQGVAALTDLPANWEGRRGKIS